jgi:outer membrane lipoprotein-sorting protein
MRIFIVASAAVLTLAVSAAAESPQDIVAAVERVQGIVKPFRMVDTLTDYVGGRANSQMVLTVYSKRHADQEYATLVRYTDPPRDRGKMVLMNGSRMWFYDSASKASVRISPQQRLMGQASNGDVVSFNLARDYRALKATDETIKDADRKDRAVWHLDLQAANDTAIYSRIEYWVEKGTYRPIKGKFYSDSGRLLKIAYYHKYAKLLGTERPLETILIDGVDPNLVTTMGYGDAQFVDIPDSWFQRDYLPRLKAE